MAIAFVTSKPTGIITIFQALIGTFATIGFLKIKIKRTYFSIRFKFSTKVQKDIGEDEHNILPRGVPER